MKPEGNMPAFRLQIITLSSRLFPFVSRSTTYLRDGYRTASPAGSGLINAVLAVRRRAVKVLLSLVINGDGNDRTEGKGI